MTTTCPACGHAVAGNACGRCGFVSSASPATDLVTVEAAPSAAARYDTALFDATVARPGTGTANAAGWVTDEPAWASAPPPWQAGQAGVDAGRSIASTVAAHLVLWLGLLLVAVADDTVATALCGHTGATTAGVLLAVLGALPVVVALVVGGRSANLRIAGLVGGLTVMGGAVFATVEAGDVDTWPVDLGITVLGLATWLTVRRHARTGWVLLLPAALLLLLWFPPFGPAGTVRLFPYAHGVTSSMLLVLWSYLPVVVMAGFGLVSSLLRPAPGPDSDATGWAVLGPLSLVVLLLMPILWVATHGTDGSGDSGSSSADYSSRTVDPAVAVRSYLQAAQAGQASVAGCNGDVPTPSVASYTIGQVSPATSGGFDVSATITAPDGSVQTVTIHVGDAGGSTGSSCVAGVSTPDYSPSTTAQADSGFPAPSLPSSVDPVPSGTTVPQVGVNGGVIDYSDAASTPTTEAQLVAHVPTGLTADEQAAVQSLIRFLTAINQQDFQSAWSASTYSTKAATYSSGFAAGYTTSRHYEVSFGEPQQLTPTLVAVPATFVSRQDPAAQGNPAGVTGCTYWPQYVFLAASVGGTWLDDTAGVFSDDPSVAPLKRVDPSRPGKSYLNPLSQRVAC